MSSSIHFVADDTGLSGIDFLSLVQRVWPGEYNPAKVATALQATTNITAWEGSTLVGSVRILSDGYFFGTIPEILVDPAYHGQGIGRQLMEMVWDISPTSLYLGAKPGKEEFYENLGYERSLTSFFKHKERT